MLVESLISQLHRFQLLISLIIRIVDSSISNQWNQYFRIKVNRLAIEYNLAELISNSPRLGLPNTINCVLLPSCRLLPQQAASVSEIKIRD